MVVDIAIALSNDIVLVDCDWGVIGPPWIWCTRDFWVELENDGVAASVSVTMELARRHDSDSDSDVVTSKWLLWMMSIQRRRRRACVKVRKLWRQVQQAA